MLYEVITTNGIVRQWQSSISNLVTLFLGHFRTVKVLLVSTRSFWWVWLVQLSGYWLISSFQNQFASFTILLYSKSSKLKTKFEQL